jgi:hypothetical protein
MFVPGSGNDAINELEGEMEFDRKQEPVTDGDHPCVRPRQRKDGSWCAEALWPYTPASHIGSFQTESEVQDWIIHNSGEYIRKHGRQ